MTPNPTTIHWVVALRPEAKPIIERFGMSLDKSVSSLFPIYRSKDGAHTLVISGPGKVNSAAATGYLAGISQVDEIDSGWINFGIAGSGGDDFGKVFLASKISDSATGRSYFPPSLLDRKISPERRAVFTVDQPCEDYPAEDVLVEMEASGFYPTVIKSQTMELCQCLKVVSDDPSHPISEISKDSVASLCDAALSSIEPWLNDFQNMIGALHAIGADPPEFTALVRTLHFSATREHQLRRLLQQWRAKFDNSLPELDPNTYADAKSCIASIKEQLWLDTTLPKPLA